MADLKPSKTHMEGGEDKLVVAVSCETCLPCIAQSSHCTAHTSWDESLIP